ncbi:MAG: Secretory immunoglobulin A-binding protein EsiB [Alphaproteobacteria bacterium MarineAlpha4_Bin2]|nr:MAG: Secretory immunoglobulin A-binding protein EsiB [Alphaproteobacteria bacterium MarineAlpha4_Bin2]
MMPRLLSPFLLVAFLIAQSATAEDFREGLRAFQLGENERAIIVFRNLATRDDRNAQFMLGVMREGGYGVEKNLTKAAQWYLKAAESGLPSAQFNLGIFYQFGQGIRKSAAEAFTWHNRAALQGHPSAQNNLASLYFTGDGIAKDPIEAWKWYEIARRNLKGEARRIALENRDKVSSTISEDERTAAKRRADDFKPVRE